MAQNFYSPNTQFYMDKMRNIASGYNSPYSPYMAQMQQPQQNQSNMMPCRPVTSAEEARAALIDAFSPHIFTNFAGDEIYAKYIRNDGTANFEVFRRVQNTQPVQQPIQEDLNHIDINEMKKDFEAKIENLNAQILQLNQEIVSLKKGEEKQNDEQSSKSSSNSKNSK